MDEKEFKRLLKICRIRLTDKEHLAIKKDVEEILGYFSTLESIDTEGVKESFHPVIIQEKTAEDIPNEFKEIQAILENTKTYRFYVVGPEL